MRFHSLPSLAWIAMISEQSSIETHRPKEARAACSAHFKDRSAGGSGGIRQAALRTFRILGSFSREHVPNERRLT